MEIKILGTGCPKCQKLYVEVESAVKELGITANIEKIQKIEDIMNYGVAMTPALVINGKIKSSGKIPDKNTIKAWLQDNN